VPAAPPAKSTHGPSKILTRSPASTPGIRACTAPWRKRSRSIISPLAKANVPFLHVCGSLDPWFKDNTLEVERRYKKLGGKIQVIVKQDETIIRSHRRVRPRLWTLSPGQLCGGIRVQFLHRRLPFPNVEGGWIWEQSGADDTLPQLLRNIPLVKNGKLSPSVAPGVGISIDRGAVERSPAKPDFFYVTTEIR